MTFAQPFQDYEILDRVGAGAMGTVFKARHKKLGRIVALKVLKPSLARDSRYVDRLRREARIVASLNHPHIVTGYDLGEEGGYHFFVMEFVEGKSLRGMLSEWGMFAEEYVLEVATQVAQALDHAFENNVIHRDIKPGNILIDEDEKVKLTDMGLAKGPADLTLTRDGATVGTPQYISPEQARNPQDVDVRSDLYSLGATLYHMATGVPPFTGDTMAELITKVLNDPPIAPNEQNPAISEGLSLVIRKLLAKDLRVRYQTPRELLDDLERLEGELPPQVDEERLAQGESDRRVEIPRRFATAVLFVLLLGGAVWVGMQLRGESAAIAASDSFIAELEEKLDELGSPGARWQHLRALGGPLGETLPAGRALEVQKLEAIEFNAMKAAVVRASARFTGAGWSELTAWLRAPDTWPDMADFEREQLARAVYAEVGLLPSEFPLTLDTAPLEGLRRDVAQQLAERDAELLLRLDEYLATDLVDRVTERLQAGDYMGARSLWSRALASFCDGVRVPAVERLGETVAQQAAERCEQGWRVARPAIDSAEAAVADALRQEVATVVGHFEDRLAAGADPAAILGRVLEFRLGLFDVWPASLRFRDEANPWPDVERMLGEVRQLVGLAADARAAERFDHRCDLAWRALCQGDAAASLAILADLEAESDSARAELGQHRQAVQAAAAVEAALLATLAKSSRPIIAFPHRGNGLVVELRVEDEGGRPVLLAQALGEPGRTATLSEFRFSEFERAARRIDSDPYAGLPAGVAPLGQLVFRLVGDEFAGFDQLLQSVDDAFVLGEIAPRIRRVRGERRETVVDRAGALAQMREELARARQTGELRKLERAIITFDQLVGENDRSGAERNQMRTAKRWLQLALREADVRADIADSAPAGAEVRTAIDEEDNAVTATMTASGAQLAPGMKEGWSLRDGVVEFVGGGRPWSDMHLEVLECATGVPLRRSGTTHTTLHIDFALPPVEVDQRWYLVQFRGLAIAVVVGPDNAVHAAFVDGDPRKREASQNAFERALRGVLDRPRVMAIPGAQHRLTIVVEASWTAASGAVQVLFEGRELLRGRRALQAKAPADLLLYPRQEIAVHRVQVRARGL